MTEICDVTRAGWPQRGCPRNSLERALESSDPDQRYGAIQRYIFEQAPSPADEEKIVAMVFTERDPDVLRAAIDFVVQYKGMNAVPILLRLSRERATREPDLALHCATLLGKLGDPQVVPDLRSLYASHPSQIIAEALLKLGDPSTYAGRYSIEDISLLHDPDTSIYPLGSSYAVVPFVTFNQRTVEQTVDPVYSRGEATILGGIQLVERPRTVTRPSAAAAKKPDAIARLNAAVDAYVARGSGGDHPEALPFFFALLNSSDQPVTPVKISQALARVATPNDLPALFAELERSPNAATTNVILDYLSRDAMSIATPGQRDQIIQHIARALGHPNYLTRQHAAQALARIHDPDTLGHLTRALARDDEYRAVRESILTAIESYGDPEAQSAVLALFQNDPDPDVKQRALEVLMSLGTPPDSLRPIFQNMLANVSADGQTRYLGAMGLAMLGERDGISLLFRRLYNLLEFSTGGEHHSTLDDPRVIVAVLEKIVTQEDIAHVTQLLGGRNPSSKLIGLGFLAQMGNPNNMSLVLPFLRERRDENKDVRFAAFQALVALAQPGDPDIQALVENETTFWQRDLANFIALENSLAANVARTSAFPHLPPEFRPNLIPIANPHEVEFYRMVASGLMQMEYRLAELTAPGARPASMLIDP